MHLNVPRLPVHRALIGNGPFNGNGPFDVHRPAVQHCQRASQSAAVQRQGAGDGVGAGKRCAIERQIGDRPTLERRIQIYRPAGQLEIGNHIGEQCQTAAAILEGPGATGIVPRNAAAVRESNRSVLRLHRAGVIEININRGSSVAVVFAKEPGVVELLLTPLVINPLIALCVPDRPRLVPDLTIIIGGRIVIHLNVPRLPVHRALIGNGPFNGNGPFDVHRPAAQHRQRTAQGSAVQRQRARHRVRAPKQCPIERQIRDRPALERRIKIDRPAVQLEIGNLIGKKRQGAAVKLEGTRPAQTDPRPNRVMRRPSQSPPYLCR